MQCQAAMDDSTFSVSELMPRPSRKTGAAAQLHTVVLWDRTEAPAVVALGYR